MLDEVVRDLIGSPDATASSLLDWAQLAQMLERNLREG